MLHSSQATTATAQLAPYPQRYFTSLTRLLFLFNFFLVSNAAIATTYYSQSTGNANLLNTWGTNADGTGSNPGSFNGVGDIFILTITSNLTTSAQWTVGGNATVQILGTLTTGGSVTIGGILVVAGSIAVNGANNIFRVDGTVSFTNPSATQVSLSGAGAGTNFTLGAGSAFKTVNVNGVSGANCSLPADNNTLHKNIEFSPGTSFEFNGLAAQATLGLPGTLDDLTINNPAGVNLNSSTRVTETLNLTDGVFGIGVNTLTLDKGFTMATGSLSASAGTVDYNKNSNTQPVIATNYKDLIFSNFIKNLPSSGTIGISGTFTTGTATAHVITGSTINFNGTAGQTVPAFNYNNLTITSTVGRGVILSNLGTIGVAGIFSPNTLLTSYTTFGSTVNFNGGAQNIPGLNYGNISATNTGTKTMSNPVLASGNLVVTNGAVLAFNAPSGVSLGVAGSITVNAGCEINIIDVPNAKTHNINVGGNLQVNSTGIFNMAQGDDRCHVNFTGSGDQLVTGGSIIFYSIGLNKSSIANRVVCSNSVTVGGLTGVNDAMTFPAGTWEQTAGTMNFSGTNSQNLFGASGRLSVTGSGSVNFGGNALISNFSFLVNTSGTVNVGTTSNLLHLRFTGNMQLQAGTVNVSGRLYNDESTLSVSGGTLNINTSGISVISNASFEMSGGATFSMSNGNVVFQNANSSTGGDLKIVAGGTKSITGGNFQFGNALTSPAQVIKINTPIPLFNCTIGATNNITGQLVNPLTVNNNFAMLGGAFDANGHATTITGTTTINAGNYLAKTALQSLNGGLLIAGGNLTGASGDITVTNMTLSSGTLLAPSGIFSVSGHWTKTVGTFTPGANTVTFSSATLQNLASGGSPFFNISHTGAGTLKLITDPLTTNGTFINSTGIVDANGIAHTINGITTISAGGYEARTATQFLNGGLTLSGGFFAGATGQVDIGGAGLQLTAGTFTAPSGECNIYGNWSKTGGAFDAGLNTIRFTSPSLQTLDAGGSPFNHLVHTSGGTLQLVTSDLVVNGNLLNEQGIFNANGRTITLAGDWTNNAGFVHGGGETIFSGAGNQFIRGTNTTNFGSFTTDKQTGEIVLETDIEVDGALALTNGIINAGLNSKIITIGALGSAGVGSNTSHVSGKLAHTFNATASKNFPVGKEGKWRPVSINLTSLDNPPTVVSVDQVEAMFTGSLPPYTTVPNARYWIISSTGGSGHVYNLTVDGTDYVPGVSAQTVILKDNGATSFYEATFSTPNYTAQNISGFSNFALAWQCNPPTIDAQPVSPAPVCTGNGVRQFNVAASGQGSTAFVYQWQQSTTGPGGDFADITDDAVYSGTTTNILTLTNPLVELNGYAYRVVIDRPCGTSTTSDGTATLIVYTPPVVTSNPVSEIKCPGDVVNFVATANGTPQPSVQWQVSTDDGETFADMPGETNSNLTFSVSAIQNNNQYRALFTNLCGTETSTIASLTLTQYTISATAGTNGIIAPNGPTTVNCGANQSFTITPAQCHQIADVVVDGISVGPVFGYVFSDVRQDHTISASFAIKTYTITAAAGANGSINPNGSTSVNCGSNQSFSITPGECYHISDVLVDGVSVGAVSFYEFSNVTANHTINAVFASNSYTISATAGLNGSITPIGSTNVNCGANQSFTITPAQCHQIADVVVDGISVGPVSGYVFSDVRQDHTISASFAIKTYNITAAAGANGSINPNGSTAVNCGTSQSFTITPDECYHIADVVVDGVSVGALSIYEFINVRTPHQISAFFALNAYTITATARANGSIVPNGPTAVDCGSFQGFTITPADCYRIADVLVDDVSVGAVAFYEFSDVNANHTINAIFASNTNTITATAGANGSIAPNGGTTVNCGSNQSFTITPDPCYQIADVLVDNISVGPVFGYTFSDVRQDHTISASFAIKTYNITATAGSNGTINPAGITVVNCNASQQYTITAAPNFHILDVLVDGVSNPGAISSGTYTFSFVQVTHTISATFAANNNPCIPTITASGPLSLCPGNDVVLTSSVALSYQWYRNNVAIKKATKQSVTATESGSYHVVARVSTACGLVSSDQVTVTISSGTPDLVTIADAYTNNNNPQGVRPNKIYKSFLPAYSSLTLVANASGSGLVYSWKNAGNQLVGSTASLQVTVAGSYTVYVSNSSGCQGVASKTVALIDVKCGGSKVQVCNSNVTQCVTSAQAQTLLTQGAFLGACTEQSLISRSQPASTDLLVNDLQVRSYPNPTSSYFTLLIKSIRTEKVQVRIVDLLGRQLETHTTAPNSTIKIGQRFMPGVYMAEIRQGKTRKIVPLYKLGN